MFAPHFGTPVRLAQSKTPWFCILRGATNTTALTDPAPTATAPVFIAKPWPPDTPIKNALGSHVTRGAHCVSATNATQLAAGVMAVKTESFAAARFIIGGSDAANETINHQIRLGYEVQPATGAAPFVRVVAAEGVATLGARTEAVANLGTVANLLADDITDTLSNPGTLVLPGPADHIAMIEVNLRNADFVEIAVDLGTAATVDVWCQLGEASMSVAQAIENLEVDLAALEVLLTTQALILSPPVHSLLPTKTTTGTSWDEDSNEAAIPANAVSLDVHVTQDCYLFADTSTGDPATDPAIYTGGVTHRIPVAGCTKLHYKRAGTNNVTITGTVHCTA